MKNGEITLVSQRVRSGQDWLEQKWSDGNQIVSVGLPPKLVQGEMTKTYDYEAGRRMAESMLKKPEA